MSKKIYESSKDLQTLSTNKAIEDIRRMFVDEIQVGRIVNDSQTPARRAAFVKQHGIAHGTFKVLDDIPESYQIGIFKPGSTYPIWVRYSSDIPSDTEDKNSTVGIGIKLFEVPGGKIIGQGTTLDFILQNTEVFFAKDAEEMAEFKKAAMTGKLDEFNKTHPELAEVLNSMSKKVESVLTESLWSCVPFRFGENDYCKYKVDIEMVSDPGQFIQTDAKNYLSLDLASRLMNGDAILNFYIQLRNNSTTQSIINARSLWSESESPPFKVAELTLPRQNINAREQEEYGEALAFNIWRTLPEFEPVGSIAEARRVIYESSSQVRRNINGQSIGEPSKARKTDFSGYSIFEPTLESPWPTGTLGNVTEDFRKFTDYMIPTNSFGTYNEVTVDTRDMSSTVYINWLKDVNGRAMKEGISFLNTKLSEGKLRIFFEKNKMKKVSFDLIAENIISTNGILKITTHTLGNETNIVGSVTELMNFNGRVDMECAKEACFDLIVIEYSKDLNFFNLNNFIMHFATK